MQKAKKAATRAAKDAHNIKEVDTSPIKVEDEEVFGMIMKQLSLKKGIKEWDQERADMSIMKEFQMLHDQCYLPLRSEERRGR